MNAFMNIVGLASGIVGVVLAFRKPGTRKIGVVAIIIAVIIVGGNAFIVHLKNNKKIEPSTGYIDALATVFPTTQPRIYGSSFTDAKPINIEQEFEARMKNDNKNKNEHWYYFDSTEDTYLTLALSGEQGMSLGIYLYDINGKDYIVSENGKDKIINLQCPIQSGKFYLKITSDIAGLYNVKPLKLNSAYTNEEMESQNDTYQKAIKLAPGISQNGHLGYVSAKGDIDEADWYKLSIENPSVLDISLIADDPLDVRVSLIGSDGDETIDYDSGVNRQIKIRRALQAGTFYIKVAKLNNYGGYVLSTEITQPQYVSDIEPNNSFQYSSKLAANNTVYGQIGFIDETNKHDVEDWYIININSATVNISLTPINATNNIHATLFDSTASDSLTSTYSSDYVATCKKEKLEPGIYYIKVSISGDTYGCYSLKIN